MACSRLFPVQDDGARDGRSGERSATRGRISTLQPMSPRSLTALQPALGRHRSRDFERSLDLDRGIGWERRNTHGGTGMPTSFAEHCHHEVRRAVQHLRAVKEIRRRINEAAEPHHADHLVEIAERRFDLCQQVDRTSAGGGLTLLDRDLRAELARSNQGAISQANLSGYEQEAPAAHEAHIIGNGRRRNRQLDPQFLKLLVEGSRHRAPTRQISRNPGGPWLIGARLASGRGVSLGDNYGDGLPIPTMVNTRLCDVSVPGVSVTGDGGRSINASVPARLCADPGCAAILRILCWIAGRRRIAGLSAWRCQEVFKDARSNRFAGGCGLLGGGGKLRRRAGRRSWGRARAASRRLRPQAFEVAWQAVRRGGTWTHSL